MAVGERPFWKLKKSDKSIVEWYTKVRLGAAYLFDAHPRLRHGHGSGLVRGVKEEADSWWSEGSGREYREKEREKLVSV